MMPQSDGVIGGYPQKEVPPSPTKLRPAEIDESSLSSGQEGALEDVIDVVSPMLFKSQHST